MEKIFIISELFVPPYDEGMKVTALSLLRAIRKQMGCIGIGPLADSDIHNIIRVPLNKLMFSFGLRKELQKKRPELLIYIPDASATLNSFIRYRILQWMSNGAKMAMIALQNNMPENISKHIIYLLRPERIFVLSSIMEKRFKSIGVSATILPMGVDMEKFTPVLNEKKKVLRDKYSIPRDSYLLLHVGHIRENRNIRLLLNLVSQSNVKVLVVGSTSTPQEEKLKEELRQGGIFIIDSYVPKNHELYQLADCYIFPVNNRTGAMEFPLSVLEAMACNLPVLTTPFGSLPEHFFPSEDFMYFNTVIELVQKCNAIKQARPDTRKKVEKFSWDNITKMLLQVCVV